MAKPEIILIGAGGHARACIEVIENDGRFKIAGLVGMPSELNTQQFGYSVIATDEDLNALAKSYQYVFIALGQIKSASVRIKLFTLVDELGFDLPTVIDPSARVSRHAKLGKGSIVMQHAVVNAGATIGSNCIINTKALIEHDANIESHCHISTGAILNGNVRVGEASFVGSGVVVKEGVSIGRSCLVGMGLALRHNLVDETRFLGD
jgi:sugar O-acyltransferase (sialic acid O-acetyltransferase NeuD family)